MKRIRALIAGLAVGMALAAHAQAGSGIALTITDSSCAATVTTAANGQQTAAPCTVQLYRLQTAAGATSCPAFSTSTYTEISSTLAMAAPSVKYSDTGLAAGFAYCYGGTVTWTQGGTSPSDPSGTFQSVIPLKPGPPTITAGD